MNGTNSTKFFTIIRTALLMMVLFTANLTQMGAQVTPPCACKGSIQVSLDQNCQATITVPDLLTSPGTCGGAGGRMITLMKSQTGGIIVGPTVFSVTLEDGGLYIGKTIYGKVADASGLNSCWTEIKIEDKIKPRWANNRPDTCVVTCPSLGTFTPRAIDNCHTPRTYQVSENIIVNDCTKPAIFAGPDTLKCITREYRAVDESGNISDSICKVVIYVTKIDDFIWPKNVKLSCDGDYARIPSGPYAGHPSPLAIGNKSGSGVPSLYPWMPTIKNGRYWIGRSTDGLRDSVSLATHLVPVGSPASAQVCLTAPENITLRFRYGSTNLPTSNDSIFYTVNGTWRNGVRGPLSGSAPPPPLPNVSLNKGQTICVYLVGSNASLTFGLDTLMTGIPLSPEVVNDCNIFVTYTDQKFPTIKCVTKILRRWTILEWACDSKLLTYDQLIEIVDDRGPEIRDLRNDLATTNGHTCEGLYKLQKPRLTDNCSEDLKYDVTIKDEEGKPVAFFPSLRMSDADRWVKLPLGCDSIFYTAYDGCHNSTTTSIVVRVEDNTPPVAVCKQNTVVGLTDSGRAWVPASSFDNGSYDECDLAKVLVRRMDPSPCLPCKAPSIPGFTYVGEYINPGKNAPHHYYISKHRASPKVAAKTAEAVGGYLVHVNNAAENKWIDDRYREWNLPEDYLIGLRDAIGKGDFTWFSGQPGSYRNWAPGYPVDVNLTPVNHKNDSIYVRARYSTGTPTVPSRWVNFDVDNCDADEYLYIVEVENPCGFSEYVEFCCADAAQSSPKVVVLRAIDKSGNWNECMVNAHVQDKLPPRISCPPNMTVSCLDYFDVAKLAHSFGWPTAYDNCNTVRIETDSVIDLTGCRIGRITRHFKAYNPGSQDTARCTQVIWVMGNSTYRETLWPSDVTIEGCEDPEDDQFSPENLGKPNISNDNTCSLVAYKYDDEVFTFNNSNGDACFKILRKWKVIDWCKFYPNQYWDGNTIRDYPRSHFTIDDSDLTVDKHLDPRINTWIHTQVIKVIDKGKPVITCPPNKTICTFDPTCSSGYIELSASATDVCTEELRWSYKIDLNNDGSFESGSQYTRNGLGNIISASGTYQIGTHKIVYTFEDRCGNLSKCEQIFTIKNCKAPTPYCLNGLATTLMPVDSDNNGIADRGMVDVWATDFDNGSFHPCPNYRVVLSFDSIRVNANGEPIIKNGRTYTCDSISTGQRRNVRIYVAAVDSKGKVVLDDNNRVVQDFCSTFIDIQDNFRVCSGGSGRITVNGSVLTEGQIPVKDVSVSLEGSELSMMTGNNGIFSFDNVTPGGNYLIKPYKNDDAVNGVSTLDLVIIQRHILGIEKISSPYKLIAADVNKDKSITAADLTELRKLILGVNDKFVNNNSWRFVDKDYKFGDANSAHAELFTEVYSLNNINSNMKVDFLSVKVGDVNGNALANATDINTETRSSQNFALNTINASFVAGQTIEVPVTLAEANSVTGFQFTLGFDADKLSLQNIEGDIIGMTDNNFGFTRLAEGLLAVSYNKEKAMNMEAGAKVMRLTFKAKADGNLAEVLNVNSEVTNAEAYSPSNDVMNVRFNVDNKVANEVVLHQNTPNPFKASTVIGFELPKAMNVTITIFDVTGKIIREYKDEYSKGFNSLEINKNELGSIGVMFYTLEAGDFKATKKMVVIE